MKCNPVPHFAAFLTSCLFGAIMRRIGVVGDGLSGLSAALTIAQFGVEVVVFAIDEPLGGRAGPISTDQNDWLFDQTPVSWIRKGELDQVLRRMKVPMPTRRIPISRMATVRNDSRFTLPSRGSFGMKITGPLAPEWPDIIRSARKGELGELSELANDAVTFLGLLTHLDPARLNPQTLAQAVINMSWKDMPRVPLDGWVGASGRLISATRLTDISIEIDGPVTGLRMNRDGLVDGIRRKGRVYPVDGVVLACPMKAKKRILESSDIDVSDFPQVSDRTVHIRWLGLSGCYMRPHYALWDADREVLAIDYGAHAPERVPSELSDAASLIHCIAYGDSEDASERIEAFMDAQCAGWKSAIRFDQSHPEMRLSDADVASNIPFDLFSSSGIYLAGAGVTGDGPPGDEAISTGIRAGRAISQS